MFFIPSNQKEVCKSENNKTIFISHKLVLDENVFICFSSNHIVFYELSNLSKTEMLLRYLMKFFEIMRHNEILTISLLYTRNNGDLWLLIALCGSDFFSLASHLIALLWQIWSKLRFYMRHNERSKIWLQPKCQLVLHSISLLYTRNNWDLISAFCVLWAAETNRHALGMFNTNECHTDGWRPGMLPLMESRAGLPGAVSPCSGTTR